MRTTAAINLLQAAMNDEKVSIAVRVTAAQVLLDRGWGKAPIQIDLNVRAKFDDFLRDMGAAAVDASNRRTASGALAIHSADR